MKTFSSSTRRLARAGKLWAPRRLPFTVAISIAIFATSVPFFALASETKTCKRVFALSRESTQAIIRELAELYLTSSRKDNPSIKAATDKNFQDRFNQVAIRLGRDQAKNAFREEIQRTKVRTLENAEETTRRREKRKLGELKLKPKLLKRLYGRSDRRGINSGRFPDGSVLFKEEDSSKHERIQPQDGAPFLSAKEIRLADLPNQFLRRDLHWNLRQVGSRWIGFEKVNGSGQTANLWIWDVQKGEKAVRKLPISETARKNDFSVSPNGRYVTTIDATGKIHRLDLDNGEIRETDEVQDLVDAWVQDDGSIAAWLKTSRRLEFSVDLQPGKIGKPFLNNLTRAILSPDRKQAVFIDDSSDAFLIDLKSDEISQPRFITISNVPSDGKIVWRQKYVWVEAGGVLHPLLRAQGLGGFSESEWKILEEKGQDALDAIKRQNQIDTHDLVHEEGNRFAVRFKLNSGEMQNAEILVADLDEGTVKAVTLNKPEDALMIAGSEGWPSWTPSISNDGRLLAIHADYAAVMIVDLANHARLGLILPENSGELLAPPRWSPEDFTIMIETKDKKTGRARTEVWAIDEDLL